MVDPGAYVAYIGGDAARMGTLAALRIGTVFGGEGEIAVLGVSPKVEAAVQRGLADHSRSRAIASDMIAERPNRAALFASGTFAVRGAFSALRVLKSRNVRLIGVAQELDLLSYLERGLIDSRALRSGYPAHRRSRPTSRRTSSSPTGRRTPEPPVDQSEVEQRHCS